MPNCDYYATIEDHKKILDFIFSLGNIEVYELYSKFEEPLKRFTKTEEVIAEFGNSYANGKKWDAVYLNLNVTEANMEFKPTYVKLDPKHCEGKKYRYSAEGFGLVQLYLSREMEDELKASHTNHFSEKGSEKWVGITTTKKQLNAMNFKAITSFSSKLNREIRKLGVAKIGGRILTKSALDLWNRDFRLSPFSRGNTSVVLIEKKSGLLS